MKLECKRGNIVEEARLGKRKELREGVFERRRGLKSMYGVLARSGGIPSGSRRTSMRLFPKSEACSYRARASLIERLAAEDRENALRVLDITPSVAGERRVEP